MDEILKRLEEQEKMLAEIYKTMHRLHNYFKWTLIVTIVFFVLPLVGLLFVIPQFLSLYSGLGELGL